MVQVWLAALKDRAITGEGVCVCALELDGNG
jgi:hypothetical protein